MLVVKMMDSAIPSPSLEFFYSNQTLKILKLFVLTHKLEHDLFESYTRTSSSFLLLIMILMSINSQHTSLSSRHLPFKPTHGLQALHMEYS
jgi:hypothetical protein